MDARLGAYRGGGIAQHVDRLLEGLVELDPPEAIVVLGHRRQRQPMRFESHALHTPPHHRLEDWALPAELVPYRLALLHCPDVVVPRGWRGRCVVTVHDVDFLRHPERLAADALRYYRRVHRAVRRADRVIVVSDHTGRELKRLTAVDPQAVRMVPNAVARRFFAPADASVDRAVAGRYSLSAPYVLSVGTVEPRKNLATLIDSYQHLLRTKTGLLLVVVGARGWTGAQGADPLGDQALPHGVRLLGYVPDEDMPALYRNSAVYAHPARDEGFGLPPLEAMACGVPVVAANSGALPEVLGLAAAYASPDDPSEWSAALRTVLDDRPLARRLAAAGKARASAFTAVRQASATLDVYREALACTRTGRPSGRRGVR